MHYATEKRYVHIQNLQHALCSDPDLYPLPKEHTCLIMQCLFITTGCDFVSYFKSFGKATILNNFLQYASFIAGSNTMGSLHQTNVTNREQGFLSFIRLVGTFYFKKHLAAFMANYGHSTPLQMYNTAKPAR